MVNPSGQTISYYKLDANTGAVLDALGSRNGTVSGATRHQTGLIGSAFGFDAADDYSNLNTIIPVNNITITCWVKPGGNMESSETIMGVSQNGTGPSDGIQIFWVSAGG